MGLWSLGIRLRVSAPSGFASLDLWVFGLDFWGRLLKLWALGFWIFGSSVLLALNLRVVGPSEKGGDEGSSRSGFVPTESECSDVFIFRIYN